VRGPPCCFASEEARHSVRFVILNRTHSPHRP
jgi:hypothetical protein